MCAGVYVCVGGWVGGVRVCVCVCVRVCVWVCVWEGGLMDPPAFSDEQQRKRHIVHVHIRSQMSNSVNDTLSMCTYALN